MLAIALIESDGVFSPAEIAQGYHLYLLPAMPSSLNFRVADNTRDSIDPTALLYASTLLSR